MRIGSEISAFHHNISRNISAESQMIVPGELNAPQKKMKQKWTDTMIKWKKILYAIKKKLTVGASESSGTASSFQASAEREKEKCAEIVKTRRRWWCQEPPRYFFSFFSSLLFSLLSRRGELMWMLCVPENATHFADSSRIRNECMYNIRRSYDRWRFFTEFSQRWEGGRKESSAN